MATTRCEARALREGSALAVGGAAALAIVALVAGAVTFGMGDQVPRGLEGTVPGFLVAAGLLGAVAGGLYSRALIRVRVLEDTAGILAVEVDDPAGPVRVVGPLVLARGYVREPLRPGVSITHLYLHVVGTGGGRVLLEETWGTALGLPGDWPEGAPSPPLGPAPVDGVPAYGLMDAGVLLELVRLVARATAGPPGGCLARVE